MKWVYENLSGLIIFFTAALNGVDILLLKKGLSSCLNSGLT